MVACQLTFEEALNYFPKHGPLDVRVRALVQDTPLGLILKDQSPELLSVQTSI